MRREREGRVREDRHQRDGQQSRPRFSPSELVEIFDDPDTFIAKFCNDAVESAGLKELVATIKAKKTTAVSTTARGVDPITRKMREATREKPWQEICGALMSAYTFNDNTKKVQAELRRDSYLNGRYGVDGRVLGALMRQCMKDLEVKLNISDPTEFIRRYVG